MQEDVFQRAPQVLWWFKRALNVVMEEQWSRWSSVVSKGARQESYSLSQQRHDEREAESSRVAIGSTDHHLSSFYRVRSENTFNCVLHQLCRISSHATHPFFSSIFFFSILGPFPT